MEAILDSLYNYILIIGKMGNIKFCNEKLLKKIDYSKSELLGNNVYKLTKNNSNEIYKKINEIKKDEKLNLDINIVSRCEEHIPLNCDIVIGDFEGEESIFIIGKDIYEKYYNREILENTLDILPFSIWIKDLDGKFRYSNKYKEDKVSQIRDIINEKKVDIEFKCITEKIGKELFEFSKADSMTIYRYNEINCKLVEEANFGKRIKINQQELLNISKEQIEILKTDNEYEGCRPTKDIKNKVIRDIMVNNDIGYHGCYNITFNDKIIGLLTLKYLNGNEAKAIMNDFIKSICNYIGLNMINKELLNSISYEIEKRDETEKELEEKRRKLEDDIKIESFKNEFFASVSHEFKTPLNIILGSVQLIDRNMELDELSNEFSQKYKKYIDTIRQNSYRLLRLVNNLIDITRIEGGFYQLQLGNYDIVSTVENITLSVAQYIENKGIDLIFDTNCEEKIIACDPDKIERIILNLMSNAIKYTKENGKICVNLNIDENKACISIEDSGIGISKDKLDLIFERYKQVDNALTRKSGGSGIGLSLVKSLVELHGGSIYVTSKEGIGTKFTFELPIKLVDSDYIDQSLDNNYEAIQIEKCSIEFSDIYI